MKSGLQNLRGISEIKISPQMSLCFPPVTFCLCGKVGEQVPKNLNKSRIFLEISKAKVHFLHQQDSHVIPLNILFYLFYSPKNEEQSSPSQLCLPFQEHESESKDWCGECLYASDRETISRHCLNRLIVRFLGKEDDFFLFFSFFLRR